MEHVTEEIIMFVFLFHVMCSMFHDRIRIIRMHSRIRIASERGQAVIVLVMITAIMVLIFSHVSTLNISAFRVSEEAAAGRLLLTTAEGYLENGAISYLRDITYPGEIIVDGNATCTITLTDLGGYDRDFSVMCQEGSRSKTVGMTTTYSAGSFTFSKIGER